MPSRGLGVVLTSAQLTPLSLVVPPVATSLLKGHVSQRLHYAAFIGVQSCDSGRLGALDRRLRNFEALADDRV